MGNYKDTLTEVVEEFWRKKFPALTEREIKLKTETDLINDIVGIRRSGKTSLMLLTAKKLGKDRCVYINFENRKLFPLTPEYFNAVIELVYARRLLKRYKKIYLFFDEVQRIEGWEKWVRSIYDEFKGRIKIFVSGSTSRLTRSRFSNLLSGRHLTTTVFPLSFLEFLSFKGFRPKKPVIEEDRARIFEYLKEYISYGGFPEIVLNENKEELIESLMLDILNRDVIPNVVKRREVVEDLVYFLCSNSGNLLSFNRIAKMFKKTSVVTVERIFALLRDVFLLFDIPIFSYSVKDQLQYPRKILCVDSGFINNFGFKFSEDRGRMMENLVGIEILRRYGIGGKNKIFYWREYGKSEGREVDFLLKEGLKVKQLIQTTYASGRDEIERREIKSLLKASRELGCKNLLVITWDYEGEENLEGRRIRFLPLWKWLLKDKNFIQRNTKIL